MSEERIRAAAPPVHPQGMLNGSQLEPAKTGLLIFTQSYPFNFLVSLAASSPASSSLVYFPCVPGLAVLTLTCVLAIISCLPADAVLWLALLSV